ncbi:MAG TPA: methyltransferase domain-containing protein, partial [Bacteroidetes bacterium]|nr:methyltransferase domain-containing protein [Bacteroidota bacterium]
NFKHVDLKNDLYNLKTETKAKDFVFPYNNEEFDFVFLTSVFTHMLPEDVEGYLSQIYRVLKNGSICFCTFFILNEESKKLMNASDGIRFNLNFGNYYLHDINVKEANVAFDEDYLKTLFTTGGFTVNRISYGYWSGRNKNASVDFQDIVVLKKVLPAK